MGGSVTIIGAGQIGFAAAKVFSEEGWNVRILARSRPDWLFDAVLFATYLKSEHGAPSADIVLDTIAYDEDDIARYDPGAVGRLIVVSSASVYCDKDGRTLDEAAQNGFPNFLEVITEDQRTVAPGPETYSTRKVRMENAARERFAERATILRPCAIHGPHSRHPREWWFVKRLLDDRTRIPLAYGGRSRFQTTSARSVGDVALLAMQDAIGGTFNVADADAPTVAEIGSAIAACLGKSVEFVPVEGVPDSGVGHSPWSIPEPMVVSSAKAAHHRALSVRYDKAVDEAVRWLRDLGPADWRAALPQLAAYPWNLFDYDAEDRFLHRRD
jgi:nucleoside-diphosphate-sugar epimerase